MKRSTIHWLFFLLSSVLVLATGWQAFLQYNTTRLVNAVSSVPSRITDQTTISREPQPPEVQLAQASALSAGSQFEAAETLLVKLLDQHKSQPLGLAAQYNLANHYFRQGTRKDLPGAQTRPMLEIAKQRYRDLLMIEPAHADARYNLELALRYSPENRNRLNDKGPPIKSVNVIVPDFLLKDLP